MTPMERLDKMKEELLALETKHGIRVGTVLKQSSVQRDGQHRVEMWAELVFVDIMPVEKADNNGGK